MTPGEEAAAPPFGDPAPDDVRILHVDDDPTILDLSADLLAEESDAFEVSTAEDAAAGLSILDSERIDCVVSDYEMPGKDGLEFLAAVRERHPDLPFILLTGRGSEEIASEAISAGVTDYLQKEPGEDQYAVLANRIEVYVDRMRATEALAESRRRLSRLIGNLPGMVYRCGNERTWPMEFVSEGCAEVTGYTSAAFRSGSVLWGEDVVHPDDREAKWEAVQAAVHTREPFEVTYRIRTADGEERLLWEHGVGVFDDDGEVVALEGFVTDVTERESLDSERRELAERLAAVIEASPEPIVALDVEDRVTVWNEAAEETFGWSREEVIGRPYPAVPDEEAAQFREIKETIEVGGSVSGREVVRKTKAGGLVVVDVSNAPVHGPNGDVIGSMAVLTDVTERNDHERTVTQLHEATRNLVAAATPQDIADLMIHTTTTVLEFPYTAVLLWDDEDEVLRVVADTPEARAKTLSPPRIMERGEGVCGTVYDTGEPAIVNDRSESAHTIVQEDTGVESACILPMGPHGVYVISSDEPNAFDERDVRIASLLATNAEAALDGVTRETELRQRGRELARQNERLERFASVLSHDLRNPLNVALGRLSMLTDESDEYQVITDAVFRIDAIVEDVLALAREGHVGHRPEPVWLASVVEEAWSTVDTAGCALVDDVDRQLLGDPDRLQRLFENLFRNAVEHAGEDATVRIGELDDADGFYVEDDGPGIPSAQREEVFEFGRTSSETGTGLGLAIAAEIAESHGWAIRVTAADGGGARFEVTGVEWVGDA